MFIKRFVKYIKEEVSKGEQIQADIREFQQKKGNLENLIMGNLDSDKDISKNIIDIVGENQFLNKLNTILNLRKSLVKTEMKIKDASEKVSNMKRDLSMVSSIEDEADRDKQSKRLEEDIKDEGEKSKEYKNNIKELELKISESDNEIKVMLSEKKKMLDEIKRSPYNDSQF